MVAPVRANLNLVRCPELLGNLNEHHTGQARRSPQHELEAWFAAACACVHRTPVGLCEVTAADSDRQRVTQVALRALRRTRDSDGRQSSLAAAVTDSVSPRHRLPSIYRCPLRGLRLGEPAGTDTYQQLSLAPSAVTHHARGPGERRPRHDINAIRGAAGAASAGAVWSSIRVSGPGGRRPRHDTNVIRGAAAAASVGPVQSNTGGPGKRQP